MYDFSDRVAGVRARIDAALRRAGDPQRRVTIVGVTKGVPAAAVDALASLGIADIGESRVQEALRKAPQVRSAVRWHLVGHLQRNKARKAAEFFGTIHSVDSAPLVRALAACGRPLEIFLQVNVSGETTKSGVPPEGARALLQAAAVPPLHVVGLMTMAPHGADPEAARPHFRALRELRDDLDALGVAPPLRALSMGMSADFEVAVEEGATHVRIGTALVGGAIGGHGLQ